MAQSKTTRGSKKKSAAKAKTRYYVVKTVQKARTNLTNRLEDYNRKYIVHPLKTGKTFVEELRSNTRDKLTDLVDEVKRFIEGVEKDTRLVVADVIDDGKKALDQLPGKQRIEKEISSRMKTMPAKFNLPSKKDIERLALQVEHLSTKVNKLSKTPAV